MNDNDIIDFLIPSIRAGGSERQLLLLVDELIKYNYNISIIIYNNRNLFYDCKVPIVFIKKRNKIDIIFIFKLYKYLTKRKTKILFSFYEGFLEGPMLYARLMKLYLPKLIVLSGYRCANLPIRLIISEFISNKLCDKIVVNNLHISKLLIKKGKININKLCYIPNIINIDKFYFINGDKRNILRENYFGKKICNKYIFGTIASYHPNKNHKIIIEAARKLLEKNAINNFHFVFYGDRECVGSTYLELENMIDNLKLNKYFSLNSTIKTINEIYNAIDALIIPSFYEGYPNVALESFLCFNPVIISSGANSFNLIKNNVNGLIFQNNNTEELADCMVKLHNSPIYIEKTFVDYLREYHDKVKVIEIYRRLFENLFMKNNPIDLKEFHLDQ